MPLGYNPEERVVALNDTAELRVTLYHDDGSPYVTDDLISVEFIIQAPDHSRETIQGVVADSGEGLGTYNGTSEIGNYVTVGTFLTVDGKRKSVRADFDVRDPFQELPSASASYLLATQIWSKIEDCFDADEPGPWLQDMTLATFNKEKMESFLDMALFDINNLNPPTTLGLGDFVATDGNSGDVSSMSSTPLLVQGGYIVCLRHLMTSYVEQPQPSGAQIAWQDRRDYLTRWTQIYTIEFSVYDRMAKLFKRQFLGLGGTRGLISSKAGRLLPAPMRTQNIGRGYW